MKIVHVEKFVPRWYEFGWEGGREPAFVIQVDEAVLADCFKDRLRQDVVSHILQSRNLETFEQDPENGFGFNAARLVTQGVKNGMVEFRLPLPRCAGETCRIDRHERSINWTAMTAVASTLEKFFSRLRFPDTESQSQRPQLAVVELAIVPDRLMHAFPIYGEVSPHFAVWLGKDGERELPEVRDAIRDALNRLTWPASYNEFFAKVGEDGRFMMLVTGNCACVHGHHDFHPGEGYEFSSHNVDTCLQQLSLLAGLAALHGLAKREIG